MSIEQASFIVQSAALPYRRVGGRIEVLLITSSNQKRWIIPKGHREPFMSLEDSAAKEAWEEAGILGSMHARPIGRWRYSKRGFDFAVEVFPMLVTELANEYPEQGERRRRWQSIEEAAGHIDDASLRCLLGLLPDFLECDLQTGAAAG